MLCCVTFDCDSFSVSPYNFNSCSGFDHARGEVTLRCAFLFVSKLMKLLYYNSNNIRCGEILL